MDSNKTAARPGHRRNKSASVLMSMISPKAVKRTTTDDNIMSGRPLKESAPSFGPLSAGFNAPFLPQDHPHAGHRVLGEISANNNQQQQQQSSRRSAPQPEQRPQIHKNISGAASTKPVAKDRIGHPGKTKETTTRDTRDEKPQPKKTKSSANLASVLAKVKSPKQEAGNRTHTTDKENTTPPSSVINPQTPIWAQFASTATQEMSRTTKVPLNDGRTIEQEIALYEPKDYSPSKQRNFYGYDQPTLGSKPRPKSEVISGICSSTSVFEAMTKKMSTDGNYRRKSLIGSRRSSSEQESGQAEVEKSKSTKSQPASTAPIEGISIPKRPSRVKAAVAAINNLNVRTNKTVKERSGQPPDIDSKEIDAAFEAVLDSRNIPENMRQGMRSLKPRVKSEFIRSWENEKSISQTQSSETDPFTLTEDTHIERTSSGTPSEEGTEAAESKSSSTKRTRPRSKTFTFSKREKGDSPAKKQKPEAGPDSKRNSRIEILPKSPSSTSIASSGGGFFGKVPKAAVPQDYVTYLRKKREIKEIEIGRMHKLRLLLRNETVQWVTKFIELGGMDEIVVLLHRIMKVEWREDHEDQVLHEALLCLKALCTTDLAVQKLCDIEKTLFSALLAMVFDPEHKGPSEFTTRQVITNILLAHLTAAVSLPDVLPFRAQTILSYLADPSPPDEKKPLPFILDMRRNRPYKLWVQETSNVAKEIFWIFIHHLNVVPLPQNSDSQKTDGSGALPTPKQQPDERDLTAEEYLSEFFPRQRPPVPAAPYIGGVEWDATNYIASHIDLLNALLASTPSKEARNSLRAELQASGLEKLMGGFLRTCKEKYYGSVHDGLKTWVAAAGADGWEVRDVRMGPRESPRKSPRKSPVKSNEAPPKLEAPPILDLGMSLGLRKESAGIGMSATDDWL